MALRAPQQINTQIPLAGNVATDNCSEQPDEDNVWHAYRRTAIQAYLSIAGRHSQFSGLTVKMRYVYTLWAEKASSVRSFSIRLDS